MEVERGENIPKQPPVSEDVAEMSCPVIAFCLNQPMLVVAGILYLVFGSYLVTIGPRLQKISGKGNRLLYQGRFFMFYFLVSLMSVFLIPIFLLRPKNVANAKMLSPICWLVSFLLGIEWEMRGEEILHELAGRSGNGAQAKGAVFIANHQSTLDSLGLLYFFGKFHPMAVVIKKEVFYVWPFGLAAYLAGSIYIDRSRGKNAMYSIEGCAIRAAKEKIKMFVFPEGTRNKGNRSWDGDSSKKGLMPFKKGAFIAAIASGIPMVPVVYSPYTFLNEKGLVFDHGRAIVKILPPISTEGYTADNITELMEKCHKVMSEEYQSLTKEVLSSLPPDHFAHGKKIH